MTQADKQHTAQVYRQNSRHLDVTTVTRQGLTEIHITVRPRPAESPADMFQRLANSLGKTDGEIVNVNIFGLTAAYADSMKALETACGSVHWPVTWVEGGGCDGEAVAGIQVQAVSGVAVRTIRLNEQPVGRVFEDGLARYCFLGALRAADPSSARAHQAREVLDNLQVVLGQTGMAMSNIVRTWLYIDAILDWYDELNAVRDQFFQETGVFEGLLPASTGIGGANPFGTALVAGALAIAPLVDSMTIRALPSPLQGSAPDYGSSFSRAVEVAGPDHHRILVSGTASIGAEGKTVHRGDVVAQIARTMEVVEAILTSQEMSYADVTRAVAYFKHTADAVLLDQYAGQRGLPPLPVVVGNDDICRDELLFEIEVDAIAAP